MRQLITSIHCTEDVQEGSSSERKSRYLCLGEDCSVHIGCSQGIGQDGGAQTHMSWPEGSQGCAQPDTMCA